MATFENPNNPRQPQKGVYGWFAIKGDIKLTLYIGEAGKKDSYIKKGTLFRGVSELQQNTFTSNSPHYDTLDTDFIVGTAIKFLEKHGFECIWKHISDDPREEITYIHKENPILQNVSNTKIRDQFRIKKASPNYWKLSGDLDAKRRKVNEAENEVFKQLSGYGT